MAGILGPQTPWPPGHAPTRRPHLDLLPLDWAPGGSPHTVGFNPFPTLLTLADSPGLAGGGQEVPTAGITGWRTPRMRAARTGPSPTSRAKGSPFHFPGRRPQTSMELRGTKASLRQREAGPRKAVTTQLLPVGTGPAHGSPAQAHRPKAHARTFSGGLLHSQSMTDGQ